MSAFVIFRYIFFIGLAVLVGLDLFLFPVHISLYLILIVVFMLVIAIGSSYMSLQFFTRAYTRILTSEKVLALTFDDGPHPEYTPAILNLLEKYNAKATFFCIGKMVNANKELTKLIKDKGHTVGNHSYSHSNFFSMFRKKRVKRELIDTNNLISEVTGAECSYFRPPYGVTNPPIASALKSLSLKVIGWNIRSFDTTAAPEKVVKRVISQIKPGSIILLHDNRPQTVNILEAILLHTKNTNYRCVSITKDLTLK